MASSAIHPIQIEIFERLRLRPEGMRFSEMCPKGIESDIYNYHLKYLVRCGFIEKVGRKYQLTSKGLEHIVDLAPLRLGQPPKLKIAAMCMVLRNTPQGLKILYQKRLRAPHLGSRAMVAGGLKRGEGLADAAKRRLYEEAGLTAKNFKWVGTLRKVRQSINDQKAWSDITYQVCVCLEPQGQAKTTKYGEHFWLSLKEASLLEKTEAIGSPFISNLLNRLSLDIKILEENFYKEEFVSSEIW